MIIWSASLTMGNRYYIYRKNGVEVQVDIKRDRYESTYFLMPHEEEFIITYFLEKPKN